MCRQQPRSGGRGTTTTPSLLRKEWGTTTPPSGKIITSPYPGRVMHAGADFVPRWVMAASSSRGEGGFALPPPAVLDGTSEEVFRWEEGGHKRPHLTRRN